MKFPSILLSLIAALLSSACATTPGSDPLANDIVLVEHTVPTVSAEDGKPIKLYVREKHARSVDPAGAARAGKAVVLVHGAGSTAGLIWDVQVPGHSGPTYSLMDYLASKGFDVFALDIQNFGRSDRHACGLCVTTETAANDVAAVVEHVRKTRGAERVNLVSWSWGGWVAGMYASREPDKVRRVVMTAPPMHNKPLREAPKEHFRTAQRDAVPPLFEGPASDPAVVDVFVNAIEKYNTQPNGVWVDILARTPLPDAKALKAPILMIYGGLDRSTPITQPNMPVFFGQIASPEKQLTIIPGAGHFLPVQKPRGRYYTEVVNWLSAE